MFSRTFLGLLMAFSINACNEPGAPLTCGENPGKDSLVFFVGARLSVTNAPIDTGSKILERVCGD